MLHQLLSLACMFVATQCWVVKVSHKQVAKKLTTNVTLDCIYDGTDNGAVQLKEITRIRMFKYDYNRWDVIAKVTDRGEKINYLDDGTIDGNADGLTNSFLNISFTIASEETVGRYKCEVDGYDINENIEPVTTPEIEIFEKGVSYEDILGIIYDMQKSEKKDFSDVQSRLNQLENASKVLEKNYNSRTTDISNMKTRINTLNNNFVRQTDDISKKQKNIVAQLNTIKKANDIKAWPEGMYTLMRPTDGCPISETFNWDNTAVIITTKTGAGNRDEISNSSHLLGPVRKTDASGNHYVTMTSCSKTRSAAGPAWPKGKYCIQSYSNTLKCPINFGYGTITFDRDNIGTKDTIQFLLNNAATNDITTLGYCCRADGNVNTPIVLPSSHSFFLYRYSGTCQKVSGMLFKNEWISLHTLGVKDKYSNNIHPDGHLNGVKLELCYYYPKP